MNKVYLENADGEKAVMWANIEWLHIFKNGKHWYTTKIKKFGIKTIYKATLQETQKRCEKCEDTEPIPVKNYKMFRIVK